MIAILLMLVLLAFYRARTGIFARTAVLPLEKEWQFQWRTHRIHARYWVNAITVISGARITGRFAEPHASYLSRNYRAGFARRRR
ncbi:hypothetical protein [Caballeronia sp. Lep1P3]|uniref:hypothetical protein n=1 Tax=Caballeronia sp. Lep1P3 TaxID=2878150 RepID=UPI001FD4E897|nr:hypothetical protein [Caballeronia sp. Lep1P3]